MKLTQTLALAALVAGCLLAGSPTLQAQGNTNTPPTGTPPGGHSMRGHPNIDRMAKELGLTDDQKAKLKVVLEDQQTKMSSLRTDASLAPADKRAKAKEIREATQTQIKAILTPEQLAKWHQHMQHNRPPSAQPPQ
jgi:protein CpxP